jgi:NADPH-dependent curcumin reductase CurA
MAVSERSKIAETHVSDSIEASTITGQIIIQLAKLGGLKVVGVADLSKHRQLLQSIGTGMLSYSRVIGSMTYMSFRHSS